MLLLPEAALASSSVAFGPPPARSIAVVPVADGDADERSAELAAEIGGALGIATSCRIVDAKLVAKILAYQEAPAVPAFVAENASKKLVLAKEHYFAFRTAEARGEIDAAIAALEARPEVLSSVGAELLDARVTQAVIAKSRGDDMAVRAALGAALRLNPALDLAAEQYPPSLIAILDEERATLAAKPVGRVVVATKPPAAEVLVDGIARGTTPIDFELPAGSHRLLIRANRYTEVERGIEVVPGGRVDVREKLAWLDAEKSAAAAPANAVGWLAEGLRIAELLAADRVILVDADAAPDGERIEARTIDRKLGAGRKPLAIGGADVASPVRLAQFTDLLATEAEADLAGDPARDLDPKGVADPALLERRKRPLHKSPVFWGILGGVLAGALGGGLAAAFSGGSGDFGQVKVEFK